MLGRTAQFPLTPDMLEIRTRLMRCHGPRRSTKEGPRVCYFDQLLQIIQCLSNCIPVMKIYYIICLVKSYIPVMLIFKRMGLPYQVFSRPVERRL